MNNQERANSCVFYDVIHDKCDVLNYSHIRTDKPCIKCKFHKTEKEFKEVRDRADKRARKTMYYEKYHGEEL